MATSNPIQAASLTRWFDAPQEEIVQIRSEACTREGLNSALKDISGAKVVSVKFNDSGVAVRSPGQVSEIFKGMPDLTEGDLPPYYEVNVEHPVAGGHVATVCIWLPVSWNSRFMGMGGQGNRTNVPWIFPEVVRLATMPRALRNGFATAESNSGNRDPRFAEWGLDPETRELDRDIIESWRASGTHHMTVIAKAIVEAAYGKKPKWSYFQGTSGGGRQAAMQALEYPNDYDGVWSSDPALNWSKMAAAGLWPSVVMKDMDNALAPEKLEAFRSAYLKAQGGEAAELGYVTTVAAPEWDPHEAVGTQTAAGELTPADADVIAKIWEGPRGADGRQLWFGLRPDTESWGSNIHRAGLATTIEVDGQRVELPFQMASAFVGGWVLKDPSNDVSSVNMDNFAEIFERGDREFSYLDPSTDISAFREAGGKLIVSHGLADEVIFAGGTIDFVNSVARDSGGKDAVGSCMRVFFTPGDGHSHLTAAGPGLTLATGMAALMNWVENGIAPDVVDIERYAMSGEMSTRATVDAYAFDEVGLPG